MSTRRKDVIEDSSIEKVKIITLKEECNGPFKAKIKKEQLITNQIIMITYYLFVPLLPLNKAYPKGYYLLNIPVNSCVFKTNSKLSLNFFRDIIPSTNALRIFPINEDLLLFYLYNFQLASFLFMFKTNNKHIGNLYNAFYLFCGLILKNSLLLIFSINIFTNKINLIKTREEKRRESIYFIQGRICSSCENGLFDLKNISANTSNLNYDNNNVSIIIVINANAKRKIYLINFTKIYIIINAFFNPSIDQKNDYFSSQIDFDKNFSYNDLYSNFYNSKYICWKRINIRKEYNRIFRLLTVKLFLKNNLYKISNTFFALPKKIINSNTLKESTKLDISLNKYEKSENYKGKSLIFLKNDINKEMLKNSFQFLSINKFIYYITSFDKEQKREKRREEKRREEKRREEKRREEKLFTLSRGGAAK